MSLGKDLKILDYSKEEENMPREIIQPKGVVDPRPRFAQVVKH
jgi:hypothetical protein